MRAIEIARHGGPEALQSATRPTPEPRRDEVLIRVAAAGVNRPDVLQRRGLYPPPPGASDIPGLEVAGTIAGLGEGVEGWREGDQVCALLAGGGYAQYCAAPAPQCLPIPRGLTAVEAASLPETFFTVWSNVFDRGRLQPGESILVRGGSGGIGTAAIQMTRAAGCRVFATAGGAEKRAACERLGAERAIDHTTEDFVEVIRTATGGRGVDVILDMVGGDDLPRELSILADDGRLVLIATLAGGRAEVDFRDVLARRLTITGSTLRPRSAAFKGAIARALAERIWPLLEKGTIRPVVYATFPLENAAEAHRLMESGRHIGKIVLTVW